MVLNGTYDPGPPSSYSHIAKVSFRGDLPFRTVHVCNHLISGTFHPPSGVLFSFPSRYWFAIGLGTYLVLEVVYSQLPMPEPRHSTQGHRPTLPACVYRALTLYGRPFQATSTSQARGRSGPATPHACMVSHTGSVWTLPFSLAAIWGNLD